MAKSVTMATDGLDIGNVQTAPVFKINDNQPFPNLGMTFTGLSCLSGFLCLMFLMSYYSVQHDFVTDTQRSTPFLPWMFLAVFSTVGGAIVSQLSFTYRRARRYYQQQSVV